MCVCVCVCRAGEVEEVRGWRSGCRHRLQPADHEGRREEEGSSMESKEGVRGVAVVQKVITSSYRQVCAWVYVRC